MLNPEYPPILDDMDVKILTLLQRDCTTPVADIGKAVRCLVNYARENPDRRDDIFGEIRCLDC